MKYYSIWPEELKDTQFVVWKCKICRFLIFCLLFCDFLFEHDVVVVFAA